MRVGLINALSLPTFVSGATIQVDRIGRALAAGGHEVQIFSGARRPRQRSLGVQTHDHQGIPVRTVNTEDFLAFEDERSYANPGVDEVLLGWLSDFKPHIVHAHSLQGLGAGWVDAAARLAPVAVTMHDWWWLCAGQFLVSQRLRVDAPLLDRDRCECWGGAEYASRRARWLSARLDHVSLVLTPSQFMRDSVIGNGIPADLVRVDSNSLDLPGRATRRTSPGGLPHLGFVGGWHDLKGLPTLLDGIRLLPWPLPFTLTCWGASESPATRNLPEGVTLEPAYEPSNAAQVMASLDALAVPSLMRESFSLVTREALHQGVPVICSDCLGPEEVVRHGVNGLVTETGSPEAWAGTLHRWGTNSELRQRIADGAAAGVAVTTPSEQAAHLEVLYAEATSRSRHRADRKIAPSTPVPRLVILAGIEGAPLRYRAHHLAAAHRDLGGEAFCFHHRDPRAIDLIEEDTVVVLYRVAWSTVAAAVVQRARAVGARTVFSVDDLVFDPALRDRIPAVKLLGPADAEQWMEGVKRYQQTAHACDAFIGSTLELVAHATAQGLVAHLVPNFLGLEAALLAQAAVADGQAARAARRAEGRCVIAYLSGTTTHDADWALVEPAVLDVLRRHAGAELLLAGHLETTETIAATDRVRRLPFRPFQELFRLQAEIDIVLAPLEPGLEFSEAKSAVKWLEAAAMRVPVIASPTGPFREVIVDGETGLLAGPNEWPERLEALVGDPDLRERIGLAARAAVYRHHGPVAEATSWAVTLAAVRQAATRATPLPPAARETPTPAALEPEAPAGYLDRTPPPPETVSRRLGGDRLLEVVIQPTYPGLCRLDLFTSTFGDPNPGPLQLRLVDSNGTLLREGALDGHQLADDGWSAWCFEPLEESSGRLLSLEVTQPSAEGGGGAAIWKALSGEPAAARVCVRVFARANREAVCAVAMRRPPETRLESRGTTLRLTTLWHKGRHSIASRGLRETAARVDRYARRQLRGRRHRT